MSSYFSLDKALSVRHHPLMEKTTGLKKPSMNLALNTAFFGEYVPKNIAAADVKQSMLNLKVVGVMFATIEEQSHVIIEIASGRAQTFSLGDSLPGGGVVKRITPDGVLIGRNGSLESLSLPKNTLVFDAQAKPLKSSN